MSAAPQIRTALLENLKTPHLPTMRDCLERLRSTQRRRCSVTNSIFSSYPNGSVKPGGTTASPACYVSRAAAGEDDGELRSEASPS